MKAYVITTGTIFSLILAAHIWRAIEEGPVLAKNPIFVLLTAASATMAVWAWFTLRSINRP